MLDLAGVEDSDVTFIEIDVTSDQHLNETAQRVVRTRRGTIAEFPDRYVDLAGYVQANTATSTPAAVVAAGVQDDLEQDERIERATCVIGQPDAVARRVPFTVTVEPIRGDDVVVEGSV